MENKEQKKSNIGLIIILIIILLLILFGVWFFLLRGNNNTNGETNNGNKQQEQSNTTNTNNDKYSYRQGELTQIVDEEGNPKQTDFIINGLILVGNRHDYSDLSEEKATIEILSEKGYNKTGLMSKFYIGEWIEMYMDTTYTKEDIKVYLTSHKNVEEWETMSASKIEEVALNQNGGKMEYQKPDEENYKYVGNICTTGDAKEGDYDILILYKDKLAYFIEVNLTKEEF